MLEVKVIDDQLVIPEAVQKEILKLQEFQITKQEMENEEKAIKEALYNAMEQNGIKSWDIEGICKFTVIGPTESKSFDKNKVQALIEVSGLNTEDYQKTVKKSGYLKVTYYD